MGVAVKNVEPNSSCFVVLLLEPGARRSLAVDESSAHVSACCKPGLLSCPGQ